MKDRFSYKSIGKQVEQVYIKITSNNKIFDSPNISFYNETTILQNHLLSTINKVLRNINKVLKPLLRVNRTSSIGINNNQE